MICHLIPQTQDFRKAKQMNRYEAIDRIVAMIYREHDEATKEALEIALKDMREKVKGD